MVCTMDLENSGKWSTQLWFLQLLHSHKLTWKYARIVQLQCSDMGKTHIYKYTGTHEALTCKDYFKNFKTVTE